MADGDYKVGKNHPPLHGRIRPGEVRNPNGRRGKPGRRKRKLETAYSRVRRIFTQRVRVTQPGGRVVTMAKIDALLTTTFNDALKGDQRARRWILTLMRDEQRALPKEEHNDTYGVVVLREPARSLEEWEARYGGPQSGPGWKDVPGYDPETRTYGGIPVDQDTGEFIRSRGARVKTPLEK